MNTDFSIPMEEVLDLKHNSRNSFEGLCAKVTVRLIQYQIQYNLKK